MQIPIREIRVRDGRRRMDADHICKLEDSIRELGLLNPITIDRENFLIAGLHRLEAVKQLGWTEVECTVSSLEGLQAELAEIDENFVRNDLSAVEYGEMLLRRKEIYESLHPETRHGGDRKSGKIKSAKCTLEPAKSFVNDTAEKLKVDPCTVRRQLQTARNLTEATKEIMKNADAKISKKTAMKLSRLEPEQQKEAAALLAAKEIKTVDEYTAKADVQNQAGMGRGAMEKGSQKSDMENRKEADDADKQEASYALWQETNLCQGKRAGRDSFTDAVGSESSSKPAGLYELQQNHTLQETAPQEHDPQECNRQEDRSASFKQLVAELKDPDKDCSGTPESFLEEYAAFVRKFHREIAWYSDPYYDTVYPNLAGSQLASLREMTQSICSAAEGILHKVERMIRT